MEDQSAPSLKRSRDSFEGVSVISLDGRSWDHLYSKSKETYETTLCLSKLS